MNYKAIEHRPPRRGEEYIDGYRIRIAKGDHIEERDVLIPTHKWPTGKIILIKRAHWDSGGITEPRLAVRNERLGNYHDAEGHIWTSFGDVIEEWEPYTDEDHARVVFQDAYRRATETLKAAAQSAIDDSVGVRTVIAVADRILTQLDAGRAPRREYTADDLDNARHLAYFWDEDNKVWQKHISGEGGDWFCGLHGLVGHNPLRAGIIAHAYATPEENR